MASRNRGVKKPTLRDLTRTLPSKEESEAMVKQMSGNVPPIVTAIVGLTLLENELDILLRPHFSRRDKATWLTLTDETGPLSTFYRKLLAAYAFGICNEVVRDGINSVRTIRNAFAHSRVPLDFSHELILKEIRTLTLPKGKRSKLYKDLSGMRKAASTKPKKEEHQALLGKVVFINLCLTLMMELLKKQSVRRDRQRRRRRPRGLLRNQLVRALLENQPPPPVNTIATSFLNQTDDQSDESRKPSSRKGDHQARSRARNKGT